MLFQVVSLTLLSTLGADARSLRAAPGWPGWITRQSNQKESESWCADLRMENNGTHYSVLVELGTPGQPFSVVADTGSNSLIVPSCVCQDSGHCSNEDRCFRGTNKSSSFVLPQTANGELEATVVTFGSGPVQAVRANDVAQVGGLKVNMSDGVLLMIDQKLDLPGNFEGILGLGVPGAGEHMDEVSEDGEPQTMRAVRRVPGAHTLSLEQIAQIPTGELPLDDDGNIPDWLKEVLKLKGLDTDAIFGSNEEGGSSGPRGHRKKKTHSKKADIQTPTHQPKSLLEQASIVRFSMCFNTEDGGVLKLGVPAFDEADVLQNLGQNHWGLDFHGISVGKETTAAGALFCNGEANMTKKQKTACGIIPDSGTTAIMGPANQLKLLMENVCDAWPRCSDNHTKMKKAAKAASKAATENFGYNPWDIEPTPKDMLFQQILFDCTSWLDEGASIQDEGLPDLHFHVAGADGKKKTLTITGPDYLMQVDQEDLEEVVKHVPGIGDVPVGQKHTGNFRRVCAPSFGEMDYKTTQHGDVWILGVPLFSQYNVGYDLKAGAMSFSSLNEAECGTCDNKKAALLTSSTSRSQVAGRRGLRKISGPLRVPNLDKTRPL